MSLELLFTRALPQDHNSWEEAKKCHLVVCPGKKEGMDFNRIAGGLCHRAEIGEILSREAHPLSILSPCWPSDTSEKVSHAGGYPALGDIPRALPSTQPLQSPPTLPWLVVTTPPQLGALRPDVDLSALLLLNTSAAFQIADPPPWNSLL